MMKVIKSAHDIFWLAYSSYVDKRWSEKIFLITSGDQEFANFF
ncbi:hypothetical protein CSC02_0072 [Enterobacter hormaechei subsp. hoffmannii]|nr:hypothetical protein CSC02_0072 [Enterobacter hormaechei subsp. hoffmannii]